jgi:hypothetical protein
MGTKSRGNWNINFCMRGDCLNRDKKCRECIRFSEYDNLTTGLKGIQGLPGIKFIKRTGEK